MSDSSSLRGDRSSEEEEHHHHFCHIICLHDFSHSDPTLSSSLLLTMSPSHRHRRGLVEELGRVIISRIEMGKNLTCSKLINI